MSVLPKTKSLTKCSVGLRLRKENMYNVLLQIPSVLDWIRGHWTGLILIVVWSFKRSGTRGASITETLIYHMKKINTLYFKALAENDDARDTTPKGLGVKIVECCLARFRLC
ncbi:hypothetical protein ACJMK2_037070 [Sinanodonta woodiana]|uniref:Uncharacterized protein n=1 Tax=Sinanodonta woodiana TaxID=1069815 RepID=A0ABD3WJ49_SINWO